MSSSATTAAPPALDTETTNRAIDLARALRHLGYRDGFPDHVSDATVRIDCGIAATTICQNCGRHGCNLWPYHRGRSYRPVIACGLCGWGEEM